MGMWYVRNENSISQGKWMSLTGIISCKKCWCVKFTLIFFLTFQSHYTDGLFTKMEKELWKSYLHTWNFPEFIVQNLNLPKTLKWTDSRLPLAAQGNVVLKVWVKDASLRRVDKVIPLREMREWEVKKRQPECILLCVTRYQWGNDPRLSLTVVVAVGV